MDSQQRLERAGFPFQVGCSVIPAFGLYLLLFIQQNEQLEGYYLTLIAVPTLLVLPDVYPR